MPPLMLGPFGGEPSGATVMRTGKPPGGGLGLLVTNCNALLGPVVGSGFLATTATVPAIATSVAGIAAMSWVELE